MIEIGEHMIKAKVIVLLLLLWFSNLAFTQNTFNKILSIDSLRESILSINQTPGGNYVFSGVGRNEPNNGNVSLVFYKTNTAGDLLDTLIYLKDSFNVTYDIVNNIVYYDSLDAFYTVGNMRSLDDSIIDGYVFKLDTSFQTRYFNQIEMDSFDGFNSILSLEVNKTILLGQTNSFGMGSSDYLLIKVDSMGNILMDTTAGGIDFEQSGNGIKVNENLFVICGRTFSEANPRIGWAVNAANAQFIAVDSNFNQLWNTVLYTDGVDNTPMIKDYGFFYYSIEYPVYPNLYREDFERMIGQIDLNNGDLMWIDTIKIEEKIIAQKFMETVDSNSFIVFTEVESPGIPYSYAKIIKYNNIGEIIWQRSYYEGNHNGCHLNTMIIDNDRYLVFGGTIANLETQSQDAWLLKLRPDGCLDDTDCGITTGLLDLTPGKSVFGVRVFPNPVSEMAHITVEFTANYRNENLELQIYDMKGSLVHTESQLLEGQIPMFNIDVSSFDQGTYLVQTCIQGKECGTGKLLIE